MIKRLAEALKMRGRAGAVAAIGGLTVTLLGWAVLSPVGSTPDDNYHLASIWCAFGDRDGLCETADDPAEWRSPGAFTEAELCFAREGQVSAACLPEDYGSPTHELVEQPHGNYARGLYPPVFYAFTGLFASVDIPASVVTMRLVLAAIAIALIVAAAYALPRYLRIAMAGGFLLSVIPFGLYLIPSTNPSGWAILSGGLVWPTLVGFFETTGRRRIALGVIATIAALIGAGARADAAAFVGVAAVLAVILTFRWDRAYLRLLALPTALSVMALGFFMSASQASALTEGLKERTSDPTFASVVQRIYHNTPRLPELWLDALGHERLGWLDTQLPAGVWVTTASVAVIALVVGMARISRRRLWALAFLATVLFVVPMNVYIQTNVGVGSQVQPRYILPLMTMLFGVALLRRRDPIRVPRAMLATAAVALAVAQSLALYFHALRYVGSEPLIGRALLIGDGNWWWDFPVPPLAFWLLATMGYLTMMWAVVRRWYWDDGTELIVNEDREPSAAD